MVGIVGFSIMMIACLQVVRCFEDSNVVHVSGKVSSGPLVPVDLA